MALKASPTQFEILLDFMERNGDLTARTAVGPKGRQAINQNWEELCTILNSDGSGLRKDIKKWQKTWSDWKYKVKNKAIRLRQETSETGGGKEEKELTPLEIRLIALIGLEVAEENGDQEAGAPIAQTSDKPSYPQLELLTEFLEEHPHLAAGLKLSPDNSNKAKQLWANVAVQLNALDGSRRSSSGWSQYWTEKKAYIKGHANEYIGLDTLPPMSTLDQRLLALLQPSSGEFSVDAEMNPLSPASSNTSAENDKSRIQAQLWTAVEVPDCPKPHRAYGVEGRQRMSSTSVRPNLKRERESIEWLQEIEQQRLTLEQERVALDQERVALEQERVALQRERNQQEARFQEQVLERMDAMSSRVADVLLQIANNRHD